MQASKIINAFKQEPKFLTSMAFVKQMPNYNLPEVAFVGRSNVGKSSLINALCSNKKLAKISKTPGRTQLINFFQISNFFILVDLPGYGYAKVPEEIKLNWQKLISSYLRKSENLKLINILIDARRGITENDFLLIQQLSSVDAAYQLVFTKIDKLNKTEIEALSTKYADTPHILASAKTRIGIDTLQASFANYL